MTISTDTPAVRPSPRGRCIHGVDGATCATCIVRRADCDAVGLPDLAAVFTPVAGAPCGCCPLPIEAGDPTGLTAGGELVHASCAT